jgi:large conductance mechanosensitive channel
MAEQETKDSTANTQPARPVARHEVVVVLPAVHAPKWMQGFVDFIREQGVVGLAVGLTLGIAAKSVVDSLVQNIFNPIIGLFYGGGDFSARYMCLRTTLQAGQSVCTSKLGYGSFVNALISFTLIAASVYFIVKLLKLDKLDKKKP